MSGATSVDIFEAAKELQVGIEFTEDPVDAALKASDALIELQKLYDQRLDTGKSVLVQAFGAYALRQWDAELERYVMLRYNPFTGTGESAGIGFVQNLTQDLPLQTIFFAVRNASIYEHLGNSEVGVNTLRIPQLAIPVLEIESIMVAP